jgi:methylenetetrahydrofolate--tRNA-(uracil-5-)-methyltransferase
MPFPEDTALGALGRYIARSDPARYQPTNIAFGLLPELPQRIRDKSRRRLALAHRALESLERAQARLRELERQPPPRRRSTVEGR